MIELSSADAKIIGKKSHGKKTESITKINLKNMTKAELKVECTKAKLPHGGTTNELTTRLEIYQSSLSKVVDGLIKGDSRSAAYYPRVGEMKAIILGEDDGSFHEEEVIVEVIANT